MSANTDIRDLLAKIEQKKAELNAVIERAGYMLINDCVQNCSNELELLLLELYGVRKKVKVE